MTNACPALGPEPLAERPSGIEVAETGLRSRERTRKPSLVPWSFPLLAFTGVSVLVVLFLCQFAHIVRLQYDLVAKKETLSKLLHAKSELELSIEQLSALNRVEKEALQLGMVHPERWQVLDLVHFANAELEGQVASATPPPAGR